MPRSACLTALGPTKIWCSRQDWEARKCFNTGAGFNTITFKIKTLKRTIYKLKTIWLWSEFNIILMMCHNIFFFKSLQYLFSQIEVISKVYYIAKNLQWLSKSVNNFLLQSICPADLQSYASPAAPYSLAIGAVFIQHFISQLFVNISRCLGSFFPPHKTCSGTRSGKDLL